MDNYFLFLLICLQSREISVSILLVDFSENINKKSLF